ncbi:hypothetical protein FG386_002311 [Cryptosporidium ryanae]|uniref:uncharacterized protein n=1 Tax=Cryptosporidium ryanae TaxID=515981 RepID=UPI00351A60FA|nr:hypothetical protein FG386_002311 [Cryptosporidium ryanae]
MKEEDFTDKKEETISIQPRLYSFDNSWEIEIQKLRKSGNLKSTIVIDQVIRSGSLFYISLVSGQLLRWHPDEVITDLILFESPIGFGMGVVGGTGNIDLKGKNCGSSQAPQIFVDQTGNHSIIVQTGGGETWYLHSGQTKAKFIQKLCYYSIQSVAWNSNESSKNSSVSVIIGCKNGIILTTILGPEISSSSTVLRILYEIPGTPILCLLLDSFKIQDLENFCNSDECGSKKASDNDIERYQYVITVSTPNKLLIWYGQNRIIDLFLKKDDKVLDSSTSSPKSCLEIENLREEYESSVCSKIRLLEISGHSFLVWITSKLLKVYSINRKIKLVEDNIGSYIGNVKTLEFNRNNLKLPNSVECSRYHIIALYDDFLDVISVITAKSIAKVPINNALITGKYVDQMIISNNNSVDLDMTDLKSKNHSSGKSDDFSSVGSANTSSIIRSLATEFSNNYNNLSSLRNSNYLEEEVELLDKISFVWGYSSENLYKINILNEGETLWKEWLYIGMYGESLISSEKIISKSIRARKRNLIQKLHFIDLMIKGETEEAISLLSIIDEDLSFNEICNIFIQYSCWEGLILYLTNKIDQLDHDFDFKNECNTINSKHINNKVVDSDNLALKFSVLGLWLIELNSYVSFILKEDDADARYYSNLLLILHKIHKIDEIEAIVYRILVEYNRRIGINYYSELRREWQVLIQEYIFYSLIDFNLVKKCFELFVSINSNISKRDALLIKYSPILGLLDSKKFISLLKRPSFSSININYVLPYLIELKQLNSNKPETDELNRLSIFLIEYYISLNNKLNSEQKLEKVSTRVKLLIHTETWKGTKTIWNVLAILCSKLENGEEFLLSYIAPLLGKVRKDDCVVELEFENVKKKASSDCINSISLLEYNIDFDIPFLLSICKKKQYKKLMAYVYCLLGMYDSAMGICIKELNNTKLAKDIIYNFIENGHLRRKWVLNLIKPLAYDKDIQGLTRLLNASPRYILTLGDILAIVPDDIQLSFLNDIIQSSMNQFDDILLKRTKLYSNYKLSNDNLKNDLFLSHKCYNIIDPKTDFCLICCKNLFNFKGFTIEDVKEFISALKISSRDHLKLDTMLNSFFTLVNKNQRQHYLFLNSDLNTNILVFPCSHYFHFGCFFFKYSVLMNNDEATKLNRIINGICKHSKLHYLNCIENKNKHGKSSIIESKLTENNTLIYLYNQLINAVNVDCLICGELMIRNINKSFLSDNDINDVDDI